jgi:diguanylate cyclase (GGDEF)-like protein
MSIIFQHINRALERWVELCTGLKQGEILDEEHYRQRVLAITSLFWLLTVIALTIISPRVIDMTPEGAFAATLLFVATGASVLASMLVLRHLDNRILALHMLLLVYTGAFTTACVYFGGTRSPTFALLLLAPVMAGIVGSMSATAFWGCLVLLIWFTIMTLERIGVQFQQIIAPQNYNVAITIAHGAMGVAITSVIMSYAEMNKRLRITLKKANQELSILSSHDDLTGLYNRRFYDQGMARSLERAHELGKPLGLIMFDLDDFKRVNDTYGHGVGDVLLTELGKRLRQQMRQTDLVARLGGDEFAVVLEDVDTAEEVQEIAKKILVAVQEPVTVRGKQLALMASHGIALYPDHGGSQIAIEEQADQAMYRAKHSTGPIALQAIN